MPNREKIALLQETREQSGEGTADDSVPMTVSMALAESWSKVVFLMQV